MPGDFQTTCPRMACQQPPLAERFAGTGRRYRLPEVVRRLAEDSLAAHPDVRGLREQRLIDDCTAFIAAHQGERPEHLSLALDRHLGATRAFLLPETTRLALIEWWGA